MAWRLIRLGTTCGLMPSAFSTRRTVVADTPIPRNRLITSRMRRLPDIGA